MVNLAVHTTRFRRLLGHVRRPLVQFAEQRLLDRQMPLVGRLLAQLIAERRGEFAGATAQVTRALRTRSDVAVFMLGEVPTGPITKILKLPLTRDAEQSTAQHHQVVETLHRLPELQSFCALVPRALAWGQFEGRPYYLETALVGEAASDLVRQQAEPALFKESATRVLLQLHAGTACRQLVDEALFDTIAGNDLAILYRLAERWPKPALLRGKLQSVEAILRRHVAGRELPFAWTHGDYWPGNILVDPADGTIGGIVDWDRASSQQLPLLDLLHLLTYMRMMQQHSTVGEELVGTFLPARLNSATRALIDQMLAQLQLPSDPEFLQAATWLYWLRFAAANLSRYPSFQSDDQWLSKNVFFVLKRGIT
jgi:aminoglycoside phosphotransferase (APT) family kinase protein